MERKTALITGITGQDGAYLAEFLLNKGYVVHGIKRRSSSFNTDRIDHLYRDRHEEQARMFLHYGDLSDSSNLIRIIQETQPDEIYNLGAMSHVHVSFETPEFTGNIDGTGALRLLEAIRLLGMTQKTKFYQASSSELYGKVQETPQTEKTPFYPRSPYAAAKLYAYWITVNYREAYNIFGCNGILFNHESPLRGETFVTRKITRAASHIAVGMQEKLYLGNLNASRDWGHAKDYVRAMYMMMQQPEPDDYVVATGKQATVREFIELSFSEIGISLDFVGRGVDETAVISKVDRDFFREKVSHSSDHLKVGQTLVEVRSEYFRPTEVESLIGDPAKAKNKLGWVPEYNLKDLVADMMRSDLNICRKGRLLKDNGHEVGSGQEMMGTRLL